MASFPAVVQRPCLMAVHAHPDDESSKGAASVAYYAARGVRCVLVSCTGGEAGEVLDPDLRNEDLAAVRSLELGEAAKILGYESTVRLGYRDSGMHGAEPDGFVSTDRGVVVADLVTIFRRERPHVVVTYDPVYAARHPDHQRCYEATCAAFDAAADDDGGRPSKLYGCRTHSPGRLQAMHEWLTAAGQVSPYAGALAAETIDETTTRIDVSDYIATARRALSAHRSQVAADDPWFFSVSTEVLRQIYPFEDYVLMRSLVEPEHGRRDAEVHEDDLFANIDGLFTR